MAQPQDDEKTPLSPSDYNKAVSFRSISSTPPSTRSTSTGSHDGKPRLGAPDHLSMSHIRPPPSPSKLNHIDDPRRFSFLRLVAAFRRRHPILSIVVSLLSMAVLILVILLGLSFSHAFSRSTPYRSKTTGSSSNYSTILPTAPIRLAYLGNFPDPSLHYDNGSSTWYVFGTNPRAGSLPLPPSFVNNTEALSSLVPATDLTSDQAHSIQLLSSTDLLTWTVQPNPLASLGAWVHQPINSSAIHNASTICHTSATQNSSPNHNFFANVWAPDVFLNPTRADGPNPYIMYYSATSAKYPSAHCIGAASAASPTGPFTSTNDALVCPGSLGGAIDSAVFVDNVAGNIGNARGRTAAEESTQPIYLLYKIDGNSRGHGGSCGNGVAPQTPTPIQLRRLDETGLAMSPGAEAVTILDRIAEDGPLVEAPSLVKVGETYTLFYSSGCTREDSYTVKYATSMDIAGPYTRRGTLLKTGDFGLKAPGSVTVRVESATQGNGTQSGASIGTMNDQWIMAFAARTNTRMGGVRALYTVGLQFAEDGTVKAVEGGSA